MLNINRIEEIVTTLRQNKRRNLLTGFGVAWGILILILLLGAGEGFQKGVESIFSGYAQNSLWIYSGQRSSAYDGHQEGERVLFKQSIINQLQHRFSSVKGITPELTNRQQIASYQDQQSITSVKGVGSDYFSIKLLELEEGRFFNVLDEHENRSVCIIGKQIKEALFPNQTTIIGESISISNEWFKVVGVLDEGSIFSQNEQRAVFIPNKNFISTFNEGLEFSTIGIVLEEGTNSSTFESELRSYLAKKESFDPKDQRAVFILNSNEQAKSFDQLFFAIKAFLWIIGCCLLLSGMVGVSNMMLVSVKERTKEIGIRKAIGAKPKEIISMILTESVVITAIAGMVGMIIGIVIIYIINLFLQGNGDDVIFKSLTFNPSMGVGALIILIFSGAIAGLIPAKKATEINTIQALNSDM